MAQLSGLLSIGEAVSIAHAYKLPIPYRQSIEHGWFEEVLIFISPTRHSARISAEMINNPLVPVQMGAEWEYGREFSL